MKLGLCLGGGGSRGYAAIPIIQKLLHHQVSFSIISGCSIGSIVGAYLACYENLSGLDEKIRSLRKRDFMKLVDFNPRIKPSLVRGEKVRELLFSIFQHTRFKDLAIPLVINAVDLSSGETRYFDSGYVVDAIMASIALPGIFPPAFIDNQFYVDGGVSTPLPYEILFEKKVKKVLAIDLSCLAKEEPDLSFTGILMKSFYLMQHRLTRYENSSRLHVLSPEFPSTLSNMLRFHDYEAYCNLGHEFFNRHRDNIFEWL